jgi:hypothetical protein
VQDAGITGFRVKKNGRGGSSFARGWPTIKDVQLLEDEIGKPLVTSGIACSWYAMKLIAIKEKIAGFGSLMANLGAYLGA